MTPYEVQKDFSLALAREWSLPSETTIAFSEPSLLSPFQNITTTGTPLPEGPFPNITTTGTPFPGDFQTSTTGTTTTVIVLDGLNRANSGQRPLATLLPCLLLFTLLRVVRKLL
mmetsp:Transcript_34267/g.78104  ORF Transcript_34267/g.78104 Transcript_34267/m.78104 type:complete len:114 (+) Transcript_34267:1920-2261(+)